MAGVAYNGKENSRPAAKAQVEMMTLTKWRGTIHLVEDKDLTLQVVVDSGLPAIRRYNTCSIAGRKSARLPTIKE